MPKREFWKMVLLVAVPYFGVGVMSSLVTTPKPSFWIVHAVTITCLVIVFSLVYYFTVKERRNGK